MRLDVRRFGLADIVIVAGSLDLATNPRLRAVLQARLAGGSREIVLDLDRVRHLDAGTVGLLLQVAEGLEELSGALRVVGAHGICLEVLRVLGVDKVLHADDEPADVIDRYGDALSPLAGGQAPNPAVVPSGSPVLVGGPSGSSAFVGDADLASPIPDAQTSDSQTSDSQTSDSQTSDSQTSDPHIPTPAYPARDDCPRWPGSHDISVDAMLSAVRALPEDAPERADLRGQVIEDQLFLARRLARRFRDRGEPVDDLIQVATLGLVHAVDGYDPTRGCEFVGYATPTIVGEIRRYFRDKGWRIKVPRKLQELLLRVNRARVELSQTMAGSPTPDDLARHLGVPVEDVVEATAVGRLYQPVSLSTADSPDGEPSPGLVLAEPGGREDPAIEAVDFRESVRPLLAALPVRERQILALRFFHEMTQSQIAAELGISQMHVSRLLSATLGRLRGQAERGDTVTV
jgi:RNA polymerase sigma-B factor